MPTLLCTGKYRKTFGLPEKLTVAEVDEGALGPWYANILNVGSQRLLHFMSSPSLLSVVIPLKERTTADHRFVESLRQLLLRLGCADRYVEQEAISLADIQFGRSSDRSKLGSLRDQATLASYLLRDGYSLVDLNDRLAETPCGPMGFESPRRVAPKRLESHWRWAGG